MICEKCKADMNWFSENSVQGWVCSVCGWNLMTTNIDKIYEDMTEYSIYIKNMNEINNEKIKTVAGIAGVNFIIARNMLKESCVCMLKDKAPKVKDIIKELEKLKIQFEIFLEFKY